MRFIAAGQLILKAASAGPAVAGEMPSVPSAGPARTPASTALAGCGAATGAGGGAGGAGAGGTSFGAQLPSATIAISISEWRGLTLVPLPPTESFLGVPEVTGWCDGAVFTA